MNKFTRILLLQATPAPCLGIARELLPDDLPMVGLARYSIAMTRHMQCLCTITPTIAA
jgi:hypothetical protein